MYYLFKTDFYEITSSLWVPRCNVLWLTGPTQENLHCFQCTVNNGYSEHDIMKCNYSKGFPFHVTLLHVVNLTDIANYAYKQAKWPVPDT